MTRIRLAEADDAEAIARIQIAGWRTAYMHILPADFLGGLDAAARAAQWRTRIGPAAHADAPTFVAHDETDAVRGFAHRARSETTTCRPKAGPRSTPSTSTRRPGGRESASR